MTILHALALGVLQGVTEFLPVSSSGHLVVAEQLFNIHINPKDMQGLNILLHAGTLLALLAVYWRLWIQIVVAPFSRDKQHMNTAIALIVATIPAGVVGILFEDMIATHFHTLLYTGIAFAITGTVLVLGERYTPRTEHMMNVRSALLMGCAQACALIPGLSRSGLTISAGRAVGINRKAALDFSFTMAAPVIGGATLLTLNDVWRGDVLLPDNTLTSVAVVSSFVSSLLAIMFLRHYVVRHGLGVFAPYLFVVSLITVLTSMQ